MIKGKTPEEIRKLFNIVNDFTPEEEAQIKKENVSLALIALRNRSSILTPPDVTARYRNGQRIVELLSPPNKFPVSYHQVDMRWCSIRLVHHSQ
jgi:hypothetical protein